ncbi:adhesion G protein-coupled receptor A3-like [Gigantopelta aegis]|uniref:adhesion G protein-coupled receptor A3-like n=1 Tax=Gigantopelta aegis TaxID=1735272 RepID=UPI001B888448|nr:adhesion G protein-coupled receptor A3-like [Gigantopelta aegis]
MGIRCKFVFLAALLCVDVVWLGEACVPSCQCTMVGKRDKKVRKVDCSKHPLPYTSLSQMHLPLDTVHLDLKRNALTVLKEGSFMGLSMLEKLNLSYNHITIIKAGAFQGLESLVRLDLSHNKIGIIDSGIFSGLPKLIKLSLSYNRINTIPEGTFNDLTSLHSVDFNSEYLRCDCHLRWLIKWSKSKKVRVHASTKCALPEAMKGLTFNKLRRSELHCNHDLQLPFFEIIPKESQIVFEGDKLPFECRASVIHQKTKIFWMRKNVTIKTNKTAGVFVHTLMSPDRTVITHSLVVENLQKSHTGNWSCQVSTPQGKVSRDVMITVIKTEVIKCPSVTKVTNKGNYTWPSTLAGIIIKKKCIVGGAHDEVTYYCNDFGFWENHNVSSCGYVSILTRNLESFSIQTLNKTRILEYIGRLRLNFNNPRPIFYDMSVMDVVFATDILKRLQNYILLKPEVADVIVEIASNLTQVPSSILRGSQLQKRACSRVIEVLDNITQEVELPQMTGMWSKYFGGLAMTVMSEPNDDPAPIRCVLRKTPNQVETTFSEQTFSCSRLDNNTDPSQDSDKDVRVSVAIPDSLLTNCSECAGNETRIQVTVFRNGSLFPSTTTVHRDPGLGSRNWTVVSNVVTVSVGHPVVNLSEPLIIKFHVPDPEARLTAAFWDFNANGGLGDWCTEGCEIVSQEKNISTVHCYHLSNFAILQDHTVAVNRHSFMMEPVIYIGSCICMLCMMAVIITYITCFRLIFIPKKMKHSVINICISVLLLIVAFTMGINRTDLELVCQIAGICIHYLTLCAIFWITITANNMFKKFMKAERPPSPPPEPVQMPLPPKPILRFYFLGWGVPIIICGITAAVNMNHYSGMEYCFLDWEPSLGAFYGPVTLLVVLNLIFFLRISCVIRGASSTLNETDETEEMHVNEIELVPNQPDTNLETQSLTRLNNDDNDDDDDDDNESTRSILDQERRPITQLRALVATLFLYIVAWVCGAFAVAKPFKSIIPYQELIFSYLYGVMSAMLGIFMLCFFCLTRKDSRLSWKRFFGCGPPPVYTFPVTTSDPPTTITPVANGNVVKSNSNMDVSTYSQKSSNITKAYNMKNTPSKQSNLNLIPVPNSSKEGSIVSSIQDASFPNFYNQKQNGAAKRFWDKNRHNQSKIMNKDVNRDINSSLTDNLSASDFNQHMSHGTSSEANTHLSIEIQIQTKDPHHGGGEPHVSSGTSQSQRIQNANNMPSNTQQTSGPVFNGPPMDRNQMTPVGGAKTPEPAGVASSHHLGSGSPAGSHLPQHNRSPSACSLGTGIHPSAFKPVNPRNNTLPRPTQNGGCKQSSPNNEVVVHDGGSVPRVRGDMDGQSQVSDHCVRDPPPSVRQIHIPVGLPSHMAAKGQVLMRPPMAFDNSGMSYQPAFFNSHGYGYQQPVPYDSSGISYQPAPFDLSGISYQPASFDNSGMCYNRMQSPKRYRPHSGDRVHSPGSRGSHSSRGSRSPHRTRPMSGEYSSDSSRQRGHRRNNSRPENIVRFGHDGSRSPIMSDGQIHDSRFMGPESDGQVRFEKRQPVNDSDHHSDPTHRKRPRPHDKYARNRGMQKQRSLGWEEQYKDRPAKVAYAYVNHNYQQKVLSKLITQASESDELAKKAFWLPRSMSEYDRLTQTGFCNMVEDSDSTTDDDSESVVNVWVPQNNEPEDLFKKETSV